MGENILQIEDKRWREKTWKGAIYSSFVFCIVKILRPGKKGKLGRLNPIPYRSFSSRNEITRFPRRKLVESVLPSPYD